MNNRKGLLKLAIFASILMFLLPLMNTPVAAVVVSNSSATTVVSNQGEVATAWVPGSPENNDDDSSGNIRFDCAYSFSDTRATPNSYHWAQMTVWLVEGEDRTFVGSDYQEVYIPPGTSPTTGTLSVSDTYTSVPTDWEILIECYCQNLDNNDDDYDWEEYNANVV